MVSSPRMAGEALSTLKSSCMSWSAFCDASRVLTWICSGKDESSMSGTLSISMSVGNQRLNLIAAL